MLVGRDKQSEGKKSLNQGQTLATTLTCLISRAYTVPTQTKNGLQPKP